MKQIIKKLKLPIPNGSIINAEVGDSTLNLSLYEIDQLEILEEVAIDTRKKINFNVKDGQYVNKGEIIFTEGIIGQKAMLADFGGIIEIKDNVCRILGQKKHYEKKLNFDGKLTHIVPGHYANIKAQLTKISPVIYFNDSNKLSTKVYIDSKNDITQEKFYYRGYDVTYYINDNLYVDDIAKAIAFGAKRLVVNSVYINNLKIFGREINKLDGFAVISGFGEVTSRKIIFSDEQKDIFWGKNKLYLGEKVKPIPLRILEHPFWGMTGKFVKNSKLTSFIDSPNDRIEVYLKNIESNE